MCIISTKCTLLVLNVYTGYTQVARDYIGCPCLPALTRSGHWPMVKNRLRCALPEYKTRLCKRKVRTARSRLCATCFTKKAAVSGAKSKGNAGGTGVKGNAGNSSLGPTKKAALHGFLGLLESTDVFCVAFIGITLSALRVVTFVFFSLLPWY